ncbi:hypothetical protein [Bradyrhizobium sp. DASA03120]|uniref:hypothetical protein n=1 Tax=Bradyrhizobium sp. SMVTL-02 TaxID=3395917 RepID=UPI003F6F089D
MGITEAALRKFAQLNYRYKSKQGLKRAHLRPRIATVRELLRRPPMSQSEFCAYWATHDQVVLCAEGENKVTVPPFIKIENEQGALFPTTPIKWRHGQNERELLRTLFQKLAATTQHDHDN